MKSLNHIFIWMAAIVLTLSVGACGGHSTTTTNNVAPTGSTPLSVVIDAGPPALVAANQGTANIVYATITICTPGSTTACQTIDHIQVDTGSTGMRILAPVLNGTVSPTAVLDSANNPMGECVVFADGHTWGSVALVDVHLGGSTLSKVPVNIIGASSVGSDPSACSTGNGPAEQTVAAFGANGIIGIGNYIQDCGLTCAVQTTNGQYFSCPSGTNCVSASMPLLSQVTNPASLVPVDNNGVTISFPSVASPGAVSLTGTLYFGVNTEISNTSAANYNAIGSARILQLNPNTGYLTATYNNKSLTSAFIDSGSNGYYFDDNSIPQCSGSTYYCPTAAITKSFTLSGYNNASSNATLTVENADTLSNAKIGGSYLSVYPTLGGTISSAANASSGMFDMGLPFFLGRKVYVIFENATVGGVQGPAVAF